jgi:DNA-binding CsgD family transcriptional regulator
VDRRDASELFGRDAEVTALRRLLARTDELPGAIALEGEAGSGKTTLLREAVRQARAGSYRVLVAGPAEAEARISFAGLRDLLDDAFDDIKARLPGPQSRALAVALLRAEPATSRADAGAVAAAFVCCLAELSADAPVLVAVDDVQWLDAPTVRTLEFAVRRLAGKRVALVVTRRGARAGAAPLRLDRGLEEHRLQRIDIPPLSLGALGAILRNRLQVSFPRPVLRRIHERSHGNPFLGIEIARAIQRGGRRLAAGEPSPGVDGLDELLRERIAALPEATRDLLLIAAALSEPTVALLTRAAGRRARAALTAAVRAQIVELDGERIRFTHPLLASAIEAAAPEAARLELHRQLAALVDQPEQRAFHLALGTEGPSDEIAAALQAAATRARARGAPGTAAELADHALRLTPRGSPEHSLRRTLEAASHHFEAGDAGRARILFERAARLAAPGPERSEALICLARACSWAGDLREAEGLYRRVLAAPELDAVARAEAEKGLALVMLRRLENLPAAARLARSAAARRAGEPDVAEYRSVQGLIEAVLGRYRELPELDMPGRPEPDGAATALTMTGMWGPEGTRGFLLLLASDRLDEARASLQALRGRGGARRRRLACTLPSLAQLLRAAGRALGTGRSLGPRGRGARRRDGAARPAGTAPLYERADRRAPGPLGRCASSCGGRSPARRSDRRCVSHDHSRAVGARAGRARHRRPRRRGGISRPLVARCERAGMREPCATAFARDEIEALIALGRFDEAEGLLRRLERRARRLRRRSALAAAGRCHGLLLAGRGEITSALAVLERAVEAHAQIPLPFERGRAVLALGQVRRRARQKRGARDALAEAAAIFADLGAELWAERARSEAGRVSGRKPAPQELTPAEWDVAGLVVLGRTNKQIAAELFMAERTVEAHISRIYAKLGIRSRVALARVFEGAKATSLSA